MRDPAVPCCALHPLHDFLPTPEAAAACPTGGQMPEQFAAGERTAILELFGRYPNMRDPDESLCEASGNGSAPAQTGSALRAVLSGCKFDRTVRFLTKRLLDRGHSPEDAEDLIQDALVKVLKNKPDRSPLAYLRRTVETASTTRFRNDSRRRRILGRRVDLDQIDAPCTTAAEAGRERSYEALWTAVSRLPSELQKVVSQVLEGRTQAECAAALHLTVRKVSDRLQKARKQLAELLEPSL
jgi:RNA polymerase sigma factor (sigma-70 family)